MRGGKKKSWVCSLQKSPYQLCKLLAVLMHHLFPEKWEVGQCFAAEGRAQGVFNETELFYGVLIST